MTREKPLFYRTDAGVHALHSSVHVDLIRRNGKQYHETAVALVLNRFFFGERLPIRVISAQHVPLTFHARYSANTRTYLYRFATAKQGQCPLELKNYSVVHTKYIPIEEIDRCFFIQYVKILQMLTHSLEIHLILGTLTSI